MEGRNRLGPDATLTVYGNGVEVVCNYGKTDFEYKGRRIATMGYGLFRP